MCRLVPHDPGKLIRGPGSPGITPSIVHAVLTERAGHPSSQSVHFRLPPSSLYALAQGSTRMPSISTAAPFGRAATPTAARVG